MIGCFVTFRILAGAEPDFDLSTAEKRSSRPRAPVA